MRAINIALPRSARNRVLRFSLLIGLLAGISFDAAIPSATQTPTTTNQKSEFIAPGIEHLQITRGYKSDKEATGPWFINMLRIDLSRSRLRLVHALDEAVGLETTSSMAARHGALAAVNSGYFRTTGTYRGDSVGVEVLNGKLLSEPNSVRAAVGLIERAGQQELIFGHTKFDGEIVSGASAKWHRRLARENTRKVRVPQPKHAVNGLNRPRSDNELIIFTPEFHRTTLTEPNGLELVVRRGRVVEVRDLRGSTVIPADGFVISTSGTAREWALKELRIGARLQLKLTLSPIETEKANWWKKATSVIGGGPQLIKDGRVEITNAAEKILPSFVNDGHPRTAIARLKSGQILLVTVDGRQPGESIGMSLTMLADLLLEFGAVEAINLDGGGSTTMVIRHKLVNKPSDATGERPVSDAILVYPR
ncbi:MAG TPA: phosphodiester glycosidase family protein [Pyrinomonadaceae bacterium]|nr:phosphodiester glycosidase family protein [Pyrinomonadaceae bacterium]